MAGAGGAVLLFYAFRTIDSCSDAAEKQRALCMSLGLRGRVRIAADGVNGTLSGSDAALEEYQRVTCAQFELGEVDWKMSPESQKGKEVEPFPDMQVRVVQDMVGGGPDCAYSIEETATHLTPREFHEKVQETVKGASDTAIIDVRNTYEYQVGRFVGAIDPGTRKFADFEDWFRKEGCAQVAEKSTVLLYCTGGIRCEKASIMVKKVLQEHTGKSPALFQLRGGVHRYLEEFPPEESLFEGKNFVFDRRVTQPVPFASDKSVSATKIVGKCAYCLNPWETVDFERRCASCRMLVLVCDSCSSHPAGLWCAHHTWLDPRKRTIELVEEQRKRVCTGIERERERELANTKRDRNAPRRLKALRSKLVQVEEALQEMKKL